MTQDSQWYTPLVLKLLAPLVGGVIFTFYTSFSINVLWLFCTLIGLFVLTIPLVSRQFFIRYLFGAFTTCFFFVSGVYLVGIQTDRNHNYYFNKLEQGEDGIYQAKLIEQPEIKANSVKCYVELQAVNARKSMGKALLYFQKTDSALHLSYGDILCFQTNFQFIQPNGNPKEFDYSRYLRIHDVVHQGYVKEGAWERVAWDGNSFYAWILGVREYLDGLLTHSGLSESSLMVAKALVLGEKESLDRETLRTYSSAGAMHVLAVSGLHVGIVMLIFSLVLTPVKRLPKGKMIFVIAVISSIWFYALITGMSSSVLRASVMFSFVIVGKELERETSVYQSILVSAFILILIEPLVIFQVGFQLSYLAVLGIVYLQPKIYNLFYSKNFLVDKIWQITSVSIAAQFATFPLGLYYFHQFPNFFMISNLIVIPLAFAILVAGLIYFVVFWIPVLNSIVYSVLEFLLFVLNKGVKWIEELPYSIYWGVSIEWYEVFWLYFILVVGAGGFILRKPKLVITTLLAVVVLLIYNVGEKFYLEKSNQLVVYNVNKSLAIDLFHGQFNTFIADESLMNDEDKLLFHVKHNWFYRTGQEEPSKSILSPSNNLLINAGNQSLYIVKDTLPAQVPQTTHVYFYDISFVPNVWIDDLKNRKTKVILGNGLTSKVRNYLKNNLLENQVHDLKESGAFIIEF